MVTRALDSVSIATEPTCKIFKYNYLFSAQFGCTPSCQLCGLFTFRLFFAPLASYVLDDVFCFLVPIFSVRSLLIWRVSEKNLLVSASFKIYINLNSCTRELSNKWLRFVFLVLNAYVYNRRRNINCACRVPRISNYDVYVKRWPALGP